jgi:hypothetical protein
MAVVDEGGIGIGIGHLLLYLRIPSVDHLLLRCQLPSVAKALDCARPRHTISISTIDLYGDRCRST